MKKTGFLNSKNKTILNICIVAVMAALFVVLDLVSIKIGNNIKITFGGLPILVAATVCGPLWGGFAGLIGSFIAQCFSYGFSATTLLWVLPAFARGLVAGLLFIALYNKLKLQYNLIISVIVSSLTVTALNTLAIFIDSKIYGYYSIAVVFGQTAFRVVSSVVTSIAYIVLLLPILYAIKKTLK